MSNTLYQRDENLTDVTMVIDTDSDLLRRLYSGYVTAWDNFVQRCANDAPAEQALATREYCPFAFAEIFLRHVFFICSLDASTLSVALCDHEDPRDLPEYEEIFGLSPIAVGTVLVNGLFQEVIDSTERERAEIIKYIKSEFPVYLPDTDHAYYNPHLTEVTGTLAAPIFVFLSYGFSDTLLHEELQIDDESAITFIKEEQSNVSNGRQ